MFILSKTCLGSLLLSMKFDVETSIQDSQSSAFWPAASIVGDRWVCFLKRKDLQMGTLPEKGIRR